MKKKVFLFLGFFLTNFILLDDAFARGGGGGSGGGGGGGGGAGGSGSGGGSIFSIIIWLIIISLVAIYGWYKRKQKIEKAKKLLEMAEVGDKAWEENEILDRVKVVFEKFQKDWSDLKVENMKEYLSESYYKRMVLEMNILQNEGRKNIMEDVMLLSVVIMEVTDEVDNTKDRFVVEIQGKARDVLFDVKENKELYVDSNPFTEYWTFLREDGKWKLDLIKQITENAVLNEKKIEDFSNRNGFYYDSDFGWLMMPNKGVIFSKTSFKKSDINNHVVGYFRNKIVEFYTYIPNTENNYSLNNNYIVAQTVLPKSYDDILVRRKGNFFNFGPWGLRRIHTESNDFEGKFCLWAHKNDQVNSLELLTPNFMLKVYDLPFELNIEVVGNFLYFYAKSRKDIDYDKMLEILSWAFDEMER
jgi:hypothetical protein